jgi:hypothetical protein
MLLFGRCCKFFVVSGVLFLPPAERVNATGFGPNDKCGEVFGAGVVEQDVHRKFGAGLDAVSFRIGSGAEVSERHGEVQRLQVLQQLVSGGPVGEGELAEGGHCYAVRAASSVLVRRVV